MSSVVKIRRPSCFVIRPFSDEFSNIWELGIRPAADSAGLDVIDASDGALGNNIIHRDISRLIWNARVIVAELTSKNPNVMYELGLAHAAKKDVVMLLEASETPPFDVAHIRYLRYSRNKLYDLKESLTERLKSTLSAQLDGNHDSADFFPLLIPVTPELQAELAYLRSSSRAVRIVCKPTCADVFFNDKWVGSGAVEVRVNALAERNTLSVCALGFFEHHAELEADGIKAGTVEVTLEPVRNGKESSVVRQLSRVPQWLRYRRRDPHNPVLMRAISNYLLTIKERLEAYEEVQDLLVAAPDWYLAQNQMGFYYGIAGDTMQARPWYERTLAMAPDHYIGSYNLACISALEGKCEESLAHLERIVNNARATSSLRESVSSLSIDPDFDALLSQAEFRERFRAIELRLLPSSPEPERAVSDRVDGYLF